MDNNLDGIIDDPLATRKNSNGAKGKKRYIKVE